MENIDNEKKENIESISDEQDLSKDAIYDENGSRKKINKNTLPWYFYVLSFFASLFIVYTIFFYLFCFVF